MPQGLELLDDEVVLTSRLANWVAPLPAHAVAFPGEALRTVLGATEGTDAIGGRLALTSFRLVFAAHGLNRITGRLSIFLPTIRQVSDTSRMLSKQITVHCVPSDTTFVVWNRRSLIRQIDAARQAIGREQVAAVIAQVEARPELLGEAITSAKLADAQIIARGSPGDLVEDPSATDLAARTTIASFIALQGIAE